MIETHDKPRCIALFTDFGASGIYIGQMQALLLDAGVPVVDLCNDAPAYNPRASAYLLAALSRSLPERTLFLCVVDPGVGSERLPVVVQTERHWFVGPDNGLFSQLIQQPGVSVKCIGWRPDRLSESFHGRDLFAPVAVRLCRGEDIQALDMLSADLVGADWSEDLAEVIYIDHFGNLMTGLQKSQLATDALLRAGGQELGYARTFSDVPVGLAFWYYNSIGVVEIAVNQGRAKAVLGVAIGDSVEVVC